MTETSVSVSARPLVVLTPETCGTSLGWSIMTPNVPTSAPGEVGERSAETTGSTATAGRFNGRPMGDFSQAHFIKKRQFFEFCLLHL